MTLSVFHSSETPSLSKRLFNEAKLIGADSYVFNLADKNLLFVMDETGQT